MPILPNPPTEGDPHPWADPKHNIRADLEAARELVNTVTGYEPTPCACLFSRELRGRAELRTPCQYGVCNLPAADA